MRTLLLSLFLITITIFAHTAVAGEVTHQQAAAAFAQLLETSNSKVSVSEASGVSVAESTAVTIADTSYETAVKVWFQLTKDGKFVNPTLHRWNPKERFRVFVQSSMPVYFAMYQTYPEDRPPTKQIYPDKRYPQTFYAVPAGNVFEIPVPFETDNDLRKETLQLSFARVDEPSLGGTVVVTATAAATRNNEISATAIAQLTTRTDPAPARSNTTEPPRGVLMRPANVSTTEGTLKLNIADNASEANRNASVHVSSSTVTSVNKDDVALYVLGVGKMAQMQLTLNK
jgi:hypothetical protein